MSKQVNEQKKMKTHAPILWGLFWLFLLIIIDQVTKLVADVYFIDIAGGGDPVKGLGERIALLPGMVELCISYNRGIAFSSFSDADTLVKIGIVAGTGVMMLVLMLIYCKVDRRRKWMRAALIMIIAGGLGNLIDRAYYQVWDPNTVGIIRDGVRDMVYLNFDLKFVTLNFGVCNFADFFICIGAAVLMASLIFFDQDALCPLGKYRAMAKEAAAREEEKQAQKKAKKQEKQMQKNQQDEQVNQGENNG